MAGAASNIKRVVTQRGKNSLQIEREKFETSQVASIIKAVNETEVPAKEKHVRVAIMGTFKDQSSKLFWTIVTTQVQLQGNPIVCWKFCHVVHKLLREGHPKTLEDSRRYRHMLQELGKLWRHLREGYGRLIAFYTKLLLQKISFHEKNKEFPGNLLLQEDQFEEIVGTDVNTYFELSVDMLDYMDDILALQSAVFGSLDMSRSNSMTNSGQCRLSPLIQCIQDSCQLYDYIVKILFKLHSSLPPDTLGGHRDRFHQQYKALKQFYHNSANLQYFKNIIRVPVLPDKPPNFLQASNLHLHVKPVAIVPEPEPDTSDSHEEAQIDMLIDTSSNTSSLEESMDSGRNGAPSPSLPDERDLMISRLMQEINELKKELARVKAEDGMLIESLHNRIKELEMELNELRQIAESTQVENETLRTTLKDGEQNTVAKDRLFAMEKIAKVNDEKFKKLKDIYQKLREEHVQLLRSNAEVKKDFLGLKEQHEETTTKIQSLEQDMVDLEHEKQRLQSNLEQSSAEMTQRENSSSVLQKEMEENKQSLENQLRDLEAAKSHLEASLAQSRLSAESLQQNLEQNQKDQKSSDESHEQTLQDTRLKLIVSAVEEGQSIIKDALDQSENPHHHSVTSTAEYLINRAEPVLQSLTSLRDSFGSYQQNKDYIAEVIKQICDFSHKLGDTIVQGFATSHSTASIEQGEGDSKPALTTECRSAGEESIKLLDLFKKEGFDDVPGQSDRVKCLIERIMAHAEELLPKIEDVKAEQMGDLVEQEMQQTSDAIEQAAKKIAEILAKSRENQTGVQLEVNEKILDSCNALMKAIQILVQKSKSLQKEIVLQGRGTTSQKEFYKKHHRWTEGLLSAAKTVGWGANVLVEAADKVVKGEGKFEELVVCSQEIAASTTQLVVASKVKADKNSKNLRELSDASKGVSSATGQVVASSKSGAQMIEELADMDFSNLTLHQAKRQEMESQVRVLELESDLEKERKKLGELRKTHYTLAGESEGWEQEDIENQ